jgi:methylphosphotriester-DNA--protein-cysteine methyltransferase
MSRVQTTGIYCDRKSCNVRIRRDKHRSFGPIETYFPTEELKNESLRVCERCYKELTRMNELELRNEIEFENKNEEKNEMEFENKNAEKNDENSPTSKQNKKRKLNQFVKLSPSKISKAPRRGIIITSIECQLCEQSFEDSIKKTS